MTAGPSRTAVSTVAPILGDILVLDPLHQPLRGLGLPSRRLLRRLLRAPADRRCDAASLPVLPWLVGLAVPGGVLLARVSRAGCGRGVGLTAWRLALGAALGDDRGRLGPALILPAGRGVSAAGGLAAFRRLECACADAGPLR